MFTNIINKLALISEILQVIHTSKLYASSNDINEINLIKKKKINQQWNRYFIATRNVKKIFIMSYSTIYNFLPTISLIHLVHCKKNNLKKLYTFVSYHSIMSDLSVLRAKASCIILRRLTGCLHTKAPTISHYTCRSVSTTSVVFGTIFSRESAGCYETAIRPLYRRNHRTYTRVYYQVEN